MLFGSGRSGLGPGGWEADTRAVQDHAVGGPDPASDAIVGEDARLHP